MKLKHLNVGCRSQLVIWKAWRGSRDLELGQGSQVLPVNGHQRLVGFLGVADDLSNAVLVPQTLDLLVALQTKMEGIPPPAETCD